MNRSNRFDRYDFLLFILVILTYSLIIFSSHPADPDADVILNNLRSFGNGVEYLKALFHLQTIDFQPVRDLTLAFDHCIVFQNALWWAGSLLIVRRILIQLYPEIPAIRIFWLATAFAVYPLFTSSVSWGMNRKHLLSFFFILLATYTWISGSCRQRKISIVYYFLSILAQPITLLWPVFAFLWTNGKEKRKLAVLSFICIFGIVVNTIYYRFSEIFLHIYPAKEMSFDAGETALALGHYSFQLVSPYILSFRYDLGHWSVMVGLAFLVFFYLLIRKNFRAKLPWIAFGILPIAIVLRDPKTISDAYLLCPALMILVLLAPEERKLPSWVLPALVLIWTPLSLYESSRWSSRLLLAQTSFERRPDCGGAFNYIRTSYDQFQKAPEEARRFVVEQECYQRMHVTPFQYQSMLILSANSYFYESDLPLEERASRLKELSVKHPSAHIAYLGFLIREKKFDEARAEAREFGELWKSTPLSSTYNPISAKLVYPFCAQEQIEPCASMAKKSADFNE